ncbi:hypothetical protein [Wenyingzhuangia sp. 2_MG-2023]|uniref:hypothetical protein n=1 Tax=Wenyingzhuangia sp. 2_MG-2023 TaxID=3062639 RepID=UPI0026E23358|nr:hypothetical protein [Wenyingzhuangia sp. 2_MG-2023]MDO6738778.1 hypothetical protein [Wenyingzhuangia sp. 2_MG-2023]
MMKKIFKYFSLLILMLFANGCEKDESWTAADLKLVPVYAITDIKDAVNPDEPVELFYIELYKTKPLLIEFINDKTTNPPFKITSYSDNSNTTNYNIEVVAAQESTTTEEVSDTAYSISGDKTTGEGTLAITIEGVAKSYTIQISEKEVYN